MRSGEAGLARETAELLYAIDEHAPLTTGSFIRPDGSIESTMYGEEFVPLRGRLPTHAELGPPMVSST